MTTTTTTKHNPPAVFRVFRRLFFRGLLMILLALLLLKVENHLVVVVVACPSHDTSSTTTTVQVDSIMIHNDNHNHMPMGASRSFGGAGRNPIPAVRRRRTTKSFNSATTIGATSTTTTSTRRFTKTKCGTPDFDAATMKRIMDIANKKKKARGRVAQPTSIVVDTYFTVVTDTYGNGDVLDSQITNQLAVLNATFAASNSIIRFRNGNTGTTVARRVKIAYATTRELEDYIEQLVAFRQGSGRAALNIYIVPNIESSASDGTTLGATFPWFATNDYELDGVFILSDTLPGGGYARHDLGLTAVHEVGHWFGLLHTFQALKPYDKDPCNPQNPNDYIADTNQMRDATPSRLGCPLVRDTCPNLPGNDPTTNYMDYGDDYDALTGVLCKKGFSPQQVARMEDVWYYYRVLNEVCASDELQLGIQFKFDNHPRDNYWDITLARTGAIVHDSRPDNFGSNYDSDYARETLDLNTCLPQQQYIFHLYDTYGDGIKAPGYYRLTLDGVVIAQGGQDFKSVKAIPFGRVPPAPTPNPANITIGSRKPTRQPSRKPTKRPFLVTRKPTKQPTKRPTTRRPTKRPTTRRPTKQPTPPPITNTQATTSPTRVTANPTRATSKPTRATSNPTRATANPTRTTSSPTRATSKPTPKTTERPTMAPS